MCCGEGTYSGFYFADRAQRITAIDRDKRAIHLARRRFQQPNVEWIEADVLAYTLPTQEYDTVMLFAALEHFSVRDGTCLLARIGRSMKPSGTLIGSTPIFTEAGGHNVEHDNEFFSVRYLQSFLEPHFERVVVWTSAWSSRVESYFECLLPKAAAEVDLEPVIAGLEEARRRELAAVTARLAERSAQQ